MLVHCLIASGTSPGYIIGAGFGNEEISAQVGEDEWFVIEADEYGEMFLGLRPMILIITNVEHDHHDYYHTEHSYWKAFSRVFNNTMNAGGRTFLCIDDPNTTRFALHSGMINGDYASAPRVNTYGFSDGADNTIQIPTGSSRSYLLESNKHLSTHFTVGIPGRHNAMNAAATILASRAMYEDIEHDFIPALSSFKGSARRMQLIPTKTGVPLYDDYGHHPSEISATLQALRELHPRAKILAIWEPHQFTRLEALWEGYGVAFRDAVAVIATEVFSTREDPVADFDYTRLKQLIGKTKTLASGVNIRELPTILAQYQGEFDVVVAFGPANGSAICKFVSDSL